MPAGTVTGHQWLEFADVEFSDQEPGAIIEGSNIVLGTDIDNQDWWYRPFTLSVNLDNV